jgi:hypothetical protein
LRVLRGTRIDPTLAELEPIEEAVSAISPRFVVIAHDPDESVFGRAHAEALFRWAGEPKALWWMPGGGHGRSMLTPDFTARLRADLSVRLRAATAGKEQSPSTPTPSAEQAARAGGPAPPGAAHERG